MVEPLRLEGNLVKKIPGNLFDAIFIRLDNAISKDHPKISHDVGVLYLCFKILFQKMYPVSTEKHNFFNHSMST